MFNELINFLIELYVRCFMTSLCLLLCGTLCTLNTDSSIKKTLCSKASDHSFGSISSYSLRSTTGLGPALTSNADLYSRTFSM